MNTFTKYEGKTSFSDRVDRTNSVTYKMTMSLYNTFKSLNNRYEYEPRSKPRRCLTNPSSPSVQYPYDNRYSNYILYVNDVIIAPQNRYYVMDILGMGTFGQVVNCFDYVNKRAVAVKVVKNLPAYSSQGLIEVRILQMLNQKFNTNDYPLVELLDSFFFRDHLCLVFELLGYSLFDLLKMNKFNGLSMSSVRIFTSQLLHALDALLKVNIIHCDLKPENILLVNQSIQLKVIDFGSACLENQRIYTYIQSRFYRAPEIILGSDYTSSIDIWSLACIIFELFYGLPLFPGKSAHEMLRRMINVLGSDPGEKVLSDGNNSSDYFYMDPYLFKSAEEYCAEFNNPVYPYRDYYNGDVLLEDIIMNYPISPDVEYSNEIEDRKSMVHMLKLMLRWDPKERYLPLNLLQHPFISGDPLDTFVEIESEKIQKRERSFSFGYSSDTLQPTVMVSDYDEVLEEDDTNQYYSLPQDLSTNFGTSEVLGTSPFSWGY